MSNALYKLQVYYRGWGENWLIGTLVSDGKQTLFEYAPDAIAKGIRFSPRYLPLSTDTYSFPKQPFQLAGLFADSLPDGWGMLLMDRYFKKYQDRDRHQIHPLERLAFLGEHTMGALVYLPAVDHSEQTTALSFYDLADAIEHVQQGEDTKVLAELALTGGSPQGARPKSLVYYNPSTHQMSTQAFKGGEPWLVKFPAQSEHPEVCAIEAAYLQIARLCDLDVPDFQFLAVSDNLSALVIKRFDRQGDNRIHMHSLAGALHADFRVPDCSYDIFLRMTRFMTQSEAEVQKAFARCVFNVCMHNRDDHTKNFAYLMNQRGDWELAPAYDLTYNTGLNGHHQMDVEGESLRPARKHLLALGKNAGLSSSFCTQTIDHLVEVIHHQSDAVFLQYPTIRDATLKTINSVITENILRLKK
jgi:serine/threonine-protein kinase HipA